MGRKELKIKVMLSDNISNLNLKTKLNKREIFINRLNRIIELYELLLLKDVNDKTFCQKYNISERTLRRDIDVLKLVHDYDIFYSRERGYHMNNKNNGILISL